MRYACQTGWKSVIWEAAVVRNQDIAGEETSESTTYVEQFVCEKPIDITPSLLPSSYHIYKLFHPFTSA